MEAQLNSILSEIYGEGSETQFSRYQAALGAFRQLYGDKGPITIIRAPGRVNLIGEHTDYNHGYVLPAALDKDILILARARSDYQINLANYETTFTPQSFTISEQIPSAPVGDWSNYARGAAQVVTHFMGRKPTGLDALVMAASPLGVPRGAGLSSSTAFTVAMATTIQTLAGWHIPTQQMTQLCSDAEWYVGTRGGIMDQFAALFGQRDHALFLDCRPAANGSYHFQTLRLPRSHRLLIVDSGIHHTNTRNEFNQRVAACRAGVGLLRRHFPDITHLRDVQAVDWDKLEGLLPERVTARALQAHGIELGELPGLDLDAELRVRACCRHVWSENGRVVHALDALESEDVKTLGELLDAAHISARDDYEISCPEIEVLVQSAREVDGVFGARLTGAGWGGCMIALVHQDTVTDFQRHVQQRYNAVTNRTAAIFPCKAGPGAGVVINYQ